MIDPDKILKLSARLLVLTARTDAIPPKVRLPDGYFVSEVREVAHELRRMAETSGAVPPTSTVSIVDQLVRPGPSRRMGGLTAVVQVEAAEDAASPPHVPSSHGNRAVVDPPPETKVAGRINETDH